MCTQSSGTIQLMGNIRRQRYDQDTIRKRSRSDQYDQDTIRIRSQQHQSELMGNIRSVRAALADVIRSRAHNPLDTISFMCTVRQSDNHEDTGIG